MPSDPRPIACEPVPVEACRKTMFHAGQGMSAAMFYFQQVVLAAVPPVSRQRWRIRDPDLTTLKECANCGERFPRR